MGRPAPVTALYVAGPPWIRHEVADAITAAEDEGFTVRVVEDPATWQPPPEWIAEATP